MSRLMANRNIAIGVPRFSPRAALIRSQLIWLVSNALPLCFL